MRGYDPPINVANGGPLPVANSRSPMRQPFSMPSSSSSSSSSGGGGGGSSNAQPATATVASSNNYNGIQHPRHGFGRGVRTLQGVSDVPSARKQAPVGGAYDMRTALTDIHVGTTPGSTNDQGGGFNNVTSAEAYARELESQIRQRAEKKRRERDAAMRQSQDRLRMPQRRQDAIGIMSSPRVDPMMMQQQQQQQ